MALGRKSDEWDRAAALMTLVANMVRGKGRRPLALRDFHPYYETPQKRQPTKAEVAANWELFRGLFKRGKQSGGRSDQSGQRVR